MRFLSVFRKSVREQLRELWLVILILVLGPFMIGIIFMVFGGGGIIYRVAVVNRDQGVTHADGSRYSGGDEVVAILEDLRNAKHQKTLEVTRVADIAAADELLKSGTVHAALEIGDGFSRALQDAKEGRPTTQARFTYSGDLANMSYLVAAVLCVNAVASYVEAAQGRPGPVTFIERPLGQSGARTEIDMYLPGLFIFAVIMLIFPTCMALARENDAGTLRRLQLTRMSAFDLLAGFSMLQLVIGALAVLCAFGTAVALGFHSQGPLWAAILIGTLCSFSIIGVGLLVACFARSVTEAFIVGNFPMMVLMFLSGAMLPLPKITLLTMGRIQIGLFDFLPTTHAVNAVNKVLGVGLGLSDVIYELVSLTLLSAIFFAAGVWLFHRRRLAAQ